MEIFHTVDGDYTGEICFLTNTNQRLLTCTAVEGTEIRLLNRIEFQQIIQHYPDLQASFNKRAIDRLDSIVSSEARLFKRREQITQQHIHTFATILFQ